MSERENIETEEWTISSLADRRQRQLDLILSLDLPAGAAILDVGGQSYFDFFRNRREDYRMIDIEEHVRTGKGGGYNRHPQGLTFDGKRLPFPDRHFDIILFSYCLHHAAEHSLGLLRQSVAISRRYLLVAEDLTGIDYPRTWLDRNHRHEPGGMFRSQLEWETLFDLLGWRIRRRIGIRRQDDPDESRFYRMNWILELAGSR